MKGQIYSTLSTRSFSATLLLCALINSALTIKPFTSTENMDGLNNKIRGNFALDFNAQSVQYCKIYDSSFNCQFCIRDRYLSGGSCVQIPYASLISHCNIYSDATSCAQCDAGYYVDATKKCSLGNADLNCLLFASQTDCLSCQSGFVLSQSKCSKVPSCATLSSTGSCTNCITGYYLSDSTCTPITTAVTNCLYYKSATECQQCQEGFALFNSTYCARLSTNSVADPSCSSFAFNPNSGCSLCREGYILSNTGCVATKAGENCFLPNLDDDSKCVACMPGFQINSNSGCDLTIVTNSAIKDPLSHPIISMMYILGLMLLLKQ